MIATLIATLVEEDHAEDDGVLAPDDRLTCHVHGLDIRSRGDGDPPVRLVARARQPGHAAPLVPWLRLPLGVVVDELAGAVAMRCPRCGRGGSTATARLIAACRASIEAHRAA